MTRFHIVSTILGSCVGVIGVGFMLRCFYLEKRLRFQEEVNRELMDCHLETLDDLVKAKLKLNIYRNAFFALTGTPVTKSTNTSHTSNK